MKKLFMVCLLSVLSLSCWARGYTLMTSLPSKVAEGEKAAEGFIVEVLQEVFKRADIPLRVKKGPWIRNQQKVAKATAREGLIIAPLTRTENREGQYDWLIPLLKYKLQFVSTDSSVDMSSVDALKSQNVCVYLSSPAEFKLRELGFENVRTKVQKQKCYLGLKSGKEKVMLTHGKYVAEQAYKLIKGDTSTLIYGPKFEEEEFYLASSKGAVSEADLNRLTGAFESMRTDGTLAKIRASY